MKSASLFLLILFSLALCHCTTRPPPAPGDAAFSGSHVTAYRSGYHHGFQDGKGRQEDDFERHFADYKTDTRGAFERGYYLGYEAGQHEAVPATEDKDRTFNAGYEAGRSDFENGMKPSHQRYRARYTASTEEDFRKGYMAGFDEAHHDGGNASPAELDSYKRGYRQGDLDAEHKLAARGESLSTDVKPADEAAFMKGYRDGYNHRTPRY
jgi:hypothetical protein